MQQRANRKDGLANPLDKFELGTRKLIEDLMIERMAENDQIVTRYMADMEFQASAFPVLAREIFDAVRSQHSDILNGQGRAAQGACPDGCGKLHYAAAWRACRGCAAVEGLAAVRQRKYRDGSVIQRDYTTRTRGRTRDRRTALGQYGIDSDVARRFSKSGAW